MHSNRSSCSPAFEEGEYKKDQLSSKLLRAGKEYQLDFYPLFSGAQLKDAKLIKFFYGKQGSTDNQLKPLFELRKAFGFGNSTLNFERNEWIDESKDALYREAPLQITDGKIPSVKLSGLSTGDYQIFVTDELNQVYTWKFVVQDKVDGKLTYQQDKMRIKVVQDSFLTGAGLSGQLDKIFGSGNYAYFIRQNWNQEDPILANNQEEANEVYAND